jgi:hypothetical protein
MNIKVKAGLDVVVSILGFMFVGATVRLILESLSNKYGTENVINGLIFVAMTALMVFLTSMLYKIRLSELQYKAKLTEMVKK